MRDLEFYKKQIESELVVDKYLTVNESLEEYLKNNMPDGKKLFDKKEYFKLNTLIVDFFKELSISIFDSFVTESLPDNNDDIIRETKEYHRMWGSVFVYYVKNSNNICLFLDLPYKYMAELKSIGSYCMGMWYNVYATILMTNYIENILGTDKQNVWSLIIDTLIKLDPENEKILEKINNNKNKPRGDDGVETN